VTSNEKTMVESRNFTQKSGVRKKVPKKLRTVNYGNQQSLNKKWQLTGKSYGKDIAEHCNAVRDFAWMKAKEVCSRRHWM